jgi:DNA (cytosine-5)-methyltransferase 1
MEALTDRAGHASYMSELAKLVLPKEFKNGLVLDLFAGCGGLSLGFEVAGFEVIGYECVEDYSNTYNHNLAGVCHNTYLDENTEYPEDVKVVIGGPPCQPFSVVGLQKGEYDKRDGFPAFKACVEKTKPDLFIFENVRGMLYRNKDYFKQICEELAEIGYIVETRLIKMVKFGIPQNRERVIAVGHKGGYKFPEESATKFTVGDALGPLAHEAPNDGRYLTKSMDEYVARYEAKSKCVNPRDLYLDRPSRTVTCRNLASATSDMIRLKLSDGRRRMLRVREAARLQGFPEWYEFLGTREMPFNQIGNAVPPLFSKQLADSVADYLKQVDSKAIIEGEIIGSLLA